MKNFGKLIFFFFLTSFLPASTIFSSDVEFHLFPTEFSLGEHAKLEIKARGDKPFRTLQTNIKKNGVRIRFSGSGTETQIINFKVSKSQILNFYIDTESEGTFKLPEVSVEYDNKTYTSPPIQFTVSKKSKHPQNQFFNPFPMEDFESPSEESPEVAFHTNKIVFYKGEPIVGYFVLYYNGYRQPFLERDPNESISFPYFLSETLRQVSVQIEPEVQRKNNIKKTLVYDKEIYGLTPIKSGRFQIGKTKFISGDSLRFNSLQETVNTTPATVTVLELPPNKPKGFTGAIGNFKLELTKYPKLVHRSETLYFEVTIEGEGGYEGISPTTSSNPNIQLISQNKTKTFRKLDSGEYGFYSVVRFQYGYQVPKFGNLQMDPYTFNFFSLKENQYKTLSIRYPETTILPTKDRQTKPQTQKQNVSKPPSIFILVFVAIFGILSYLGLVRYIHRKQTKEFMELITSFGKKRNSFLFDYLRKLELPEEDSQFLVNLVEAGEKETLEKTFHNLNKKEKSKLLSLIKQLKPKD
ncbi:BatD family protein [Leptospira kanakyensis]|uniref:BatD family protein n=1 Tax=Leptospira kanakyensis TaxID=2484968 RepID=UPI00223E6128|nr:BatD family protein [Leptospira kanakyensis]MCW7470908.1 BatD family protein [Leptospira kanakyensis]